MSHAKVDIIYKITTEKAWDEALVSGNLAPSSDDARDGFIHLSARHQLAATAAKYYKSQTGLRLVAYRAGQLAGLRWEASRGGDLFPHVYGPLPAELALWSRPLPLDGAGVPETDDVVEDASGESPS